MAANYSYGFSNDGHRSSYTESTYSRTTSAPSYPGQNMQNYSYSADVRYPKGSQNTQPVSYGGHQNYMERNSSYGAWKDNRTQQTAFNHDCQESNIYENNPPLDSYNHSQSYQDIEPQNQEYNHYMEEKRDSRKGSWNMPTWDMNQASSFSCEPVEHSEASSNYHHQQPNRFGHGSWGSKDSRTNGTGTKYARNAPYVNTHVKSKGQPKPQQLHYCDICRISCAGYQTYKEHLEGQKHKKKELAVTTQVPVRGVHTQLHCQLCDISCTGPDAYTAHIKGAKHQKVVKLHTRLGKPIPDPEPVITQICISGSSSKSLTSASTGMQNLEQKQLDFSANSESLPTASAFSSTSSKQSSSMLEMEEGHMDTQDTFYGISLQPVGESYVEEIHNEEGKTIRFHCKLCECSFNDTNARDLHLKGRRHRLQYKKKVNPRLSIDVKPSNRPWKQEENMRRRWEHRQAMQRFLDEEQMWLMEMRHYEDMYRRELEEEYLFWEYQQMRRMQLEWSHMGRGRPPYSRYNSPQVNESVDDQYIMRKHAQIYPTEKELQAIQKTVSLSERALKLVSDCIKKEFGDKDASKPENTCLLRGVKRVGILSKGLILHGNQDFQLTLLCSKKPTCSLLKRIAEVLPEQLEKLSKRQHTVTCDIEEAHLLITFTDEPKMQFTVFLTCNNMFAKNEETKEEVEKKENVENEDLEKDTYTTDTNILLSEEKCKESLTRLHQAQWFQLHASDLKSCVIVIRIFRDLRQRVSVWRALSDWAMELIVQKALSSVSLSPGEATVRVLECIASGVLLPDGPGIQDPCQKEMFDVLASLTNQECEDITANAQQSLRMISFRQIHKVLDMEPFRSTRQSRQNRKRPSDNSDSGLRKRKKDKKEIEDNVQKPN
ncbi:zinc finger RNA-binding protein 2 isoform 2-T2 [Mantella aurantiaca]